MINAPIQLTGINIDKLLLTTDSDFDLTNEEDTFDIQEYVSLALSDDKRSAKVKLGLKIDPEGKPVAFDVQATASLIYIGSDLPEDETILSERFAIIGCNALYGIIKSQIYSLTAFTFVGPRMLPIASFTDKKGAFTKKKDNEQLQQ